MFHAVGYPSDPLLQRHRFGCDGGMDVDTRFCLNKMARVFFSKNEERAAKLSRCSPLTLCELISDAKLEAADMSIMKKPAFLFGDSITVDDKQLHDGNYKWLRKIGDRFMFLPNMVRTVPLSYLQSMSVPRPMDWDLTRFNDGVSLG